MAEHYPSPDRAGASHLRYAMAFHSAGSMALASRPAPAQDWPTRPVRIVAPFAPGGSADTLGRMVAERLSVRFKQNFVVDNRAGAGGTVGSELVAKSCA